MRHIIVLLQKEWFELRRNRSLLFGLLLVPLLLTTSMLFAINDAGQLPEGGIPEGSAIRADPSLADMEAAELGQVLLGRQFGIAFLFVPIFIPIIIASYSIVGEKTRRTLEPLLATPLHTWELLVAKVFAALIPSIIVTWVCSGVYIGAIALMAVTSNVFTAIINPAWILMMLLCAPLLSLIVIVAYVAISSRVADPRTAQQISSAVIILLIISFTQIADRIVLSPATVVSSTTVLALIAVVAIWGAVRLFQRETILTRWS